MIGTTEAAQLLGICCQRVRKLLKQGRIVGALKVGRFWQIPLFRGMPQVIEVNRGLSGTWRKGRRRANLLIHVNQQKLACNRNPDKTEKEPVIIVRQGDDKINCNSAVIYGPSRIVYRPEKPLGCGARLWIEVAPFVKVKTELTSYSFISGFDNYLPMFSSS